MSEETEKTNELVGYLAYARALTEDQWQDEFHNGFLWKAFEREIDALWKRPPMSSAAKRLCLDLPGDSDVATLHNVSMSSDKCWLFITFEYGVWSEPYTSSNAEERVETSDDGERDFYLFDISMVLDIDADLHVSSELVDICAQSSEAKC